MSRDEKIRKLEEYKGKLLQWRQTPNASLRSFINQNTVWVRREVVEAGCYHTLTVGPFTLFAESMTSGVGLAFSRSARTFRQDFAMCATMPISLRPGLLRRAGKRSRYDESEYGRSSGPHDLTVHRTAGSCRSPRGRRPCALASVELILRAAEVEKGVNDDHQLPSQGVFLHAVLRHLADHPEGDRRNNVHEAMPKLVGLTESQRTERLASGKPRTAHGAGGA
jgi:hypothetical protein